MAEIRVHPKPRSRVWLLFALVVAALVAWYLVSQGLLGVHQTALAHASPARTAIPVRS